MIVMIGPFRFDTQQYRLERDGKQIGLTTMEARTLIALATHANTVCTFKQLSQEVYEIDDASSILRSKIRHLRQKIEPDPRNPIYILTVPDVGYQLNI